jgi:GT2 family glycosyltransferase
MVYNAVQAIPRQIEALLAQTRSLQEIIVVDNASTDGTCALLAERYPQITVLRIPENLGAAGAWALGLSHAVGKAHDWVWTFDDDSVPELNGLELLLNEIGTIGSGEGEVGMAVPMPVHRETNTSYPPWFWRNGLVKPTTVQMQKPIWFADLAIASGSLVRREVVEKIGLPRADFFMDVFDLEYCLRIRANGYKIAVVTRAELAHEVGSARKIRLPGYKRLWSDQPPWREYYISRNLTYMTWRLYPSGGAKRSVLRYLCVHAIGVLLFSSKKLASFGKMAQGAWDGLRGRLGIRFRPDAKGNCKTGRLIAVSEDAGKA